MWGSNICQSPAPHGRWWVGVVECVRLRGDGVDLIQRIGDIHSSKPHMEEEEEAHDMMLGMKQCYGTLCRHTHTDKPFSLLSFLLCFFSPTTVIFAVLAGA